MQLYPRKLHIQWKIHPTHLTTLNLYTYNVTVGPKEIKGTQRARGSQRIENIIENDFHIFCYSFKLARDICMIYFALFVLEKAMR